MLVCSIVFIVVFGRISCRNCRTHYESFALSEQAMYSAFVMDIDTTSCRLELHIIGTPYRVTSDPLYDREFSPPYEVSANMSIQTSWFSFCDIVMSNPSSLVEAKYRPTWSATCMLFIPGLEVCLPSRFTCTEISGLVIRLM